MYTDEQILSMTKVSTKVAAEYLGTTVESIAYALQSDTIEGTHVLPIGFATRSQNGIRWNYVIVPQRLVAYKNGTGKEDIERLLSEVRNSLDKVIDYLREAIR